MARRRRCALTSAWSWETPNPCWARSSPCDEAARRQCRMSDARHPYEALTPDVVLDALLPLGLYGDGRLLGLSSYENRVYQVHLEEPFHGSEVVVLKFYRPGRWSDVQILEEHAFAAQLERAEVPAVAPLAPGGRT